jgi:WD40 repeat protein
MSALLSSIRMRPARGFAGARLERKLPDAATVLFSPACDRLASAGSELTLFRLDRWKREWHIRPQPGVRHAAFSPGGGELVLKNGEGAVAVVDVHSGRRWWAVEQALDGEGSNACFSACGEYLVDGGHNGALNVRSAVDGELEFRCQFHASAITHVERVPASLLWLVVHEPYGAPADEPVAAPSITVHSWPFTGRVERRDAFAAGQRVQAMAASPDGACYAVALRSGAACELLVLAVADGQVLRRELLPTSGPVALAWTPDGRVLACAGGDDVELRDAGTLQLSRRFGAAQPRGLQFSGDGKWLAVASATQSRLLALDPAVAG